MTGTDTSVGRPQLDAAAGEPSAPEHFERLLALVKAMAQPSRLRLLGLLATDERTVEELAGLLRLKAPTVSHHLAQLRDAGLVRMRSDGTTHLHSLDERGLGTLRKELLRPERLASLADDVDLDRWERKVLQTFVEGDQLVDIPASRKKRDVILRWLVEKFERGVDYPEKEINAVLLRHHWDSATLRREFIATKLMTRERGIYRRTAA